MDNGILNCTFKNVLKDLFKLNPSQSYGYELSHGSKPNPSCVRCELFLTTV